MIKYDLIIVGGGLAGTAAAISAGRNGLSVLLIEKGNALGGAAVNCLVNPFMPNYTKEKNNGASKNVLLSRGIFTEIVGELREMNAVVGESPSIYHEEHLKLVLNRMVIAANVQLLFHSYLIEAEIDNTEIKTVTVANKSGKQIFTADYFIDTTGDADLAYMCRCPTRLGRESDGLCQPMTLCFRAANVDVEKFNADYDNFNRLYKEKKALGEIKNIREDVLVFNNLVKNVVHFNSTRIVKRNPVEAFDRTMAEIEAREQAWELFTFMKTNARGFEHADFLITAMEIGVRESRMIDGEYILTSDDLIACKQFNDSIALGNYDIDIHNPEGSGTSHYYFPEGKYYTIPFRSLIPKGINNLLVAGRCISATHEAQASIRILPIVCCLGEASGTAFSVAKESGDTIRETSIVDIQNRLKAQGACF